MRADSPSLSSRTRGLLIGLAAGNRLGSPWAETWPREKIRAGTGGTVREVLPDERARPVDAEVAQFQLLGEELLERGQVDLESLGRRLLGWMEAGGRGVPVLTRKVLEDVATGTPVEEASSYACESLGKNWSAANGSLARGLALVPVFWGQTSRLIEESRTAARATHWNPLCEWSSAALNLAFSDALSDIPLDCRALAESLRPLGAPPAVCDAVDGAKAPLERFQLDDKTKLFTLKAMKVGLWALRAEGSPEELVERVVLEGGATAVNAALAGAAAGIRLGAEALPEAWKALPEIPALEALAERLSTLSA